MIAAAGGVSPRRQFEVDSLSVFVHADRAELGKHAALQAAAAIRERIDQAGRVVILFASAPSQREMLEELIRVDGIDWTKVVGLHVDEYVGVGVDEPHSFRKYLIDQVTNRVPIGEFHGIQGEAVDPESECRRYSKLLEENPPDVALLGIGENGHLAFNDPPVADFEDPLAVKQVELDETCRLQQVNDGCFDSLDLVPKHALTLTVPAMFRARRLVVSVPGSTKSQAVKDALQGPITTACPASILRRHRAAVLLLDEESAAHV
jgi:glucosamine-6-phosphate deaminase